MLRIPSVHGSTSNSHMNVKTMSPAPSLQNLHDPAHYHGSGQQKMMLPRRLSNAEMRSVDPHAEYNDPYRNGNSFYQQQHGAPMDGHFPRALIPDDGRHMHHHRQPEGQHRPRALIPDNGHHHHVEERLNNPHGSYPQPQFQHHAPYYHPSDQYQHAPPQQQYYQQQYPPAPGNYYDPVNNNDGYESSSSHSRRASSQQPSMPNTVYHQPPPQQQQYRHGPPPVPQPYYVQEHQQHMQQHYQQPHQPSGYLDMPSPTAQTVDYPPTHPPRHSHGNHNANNSSAVHEPKPARRTGTVSAASPAPSETASATSASSSIAGHNFDASKLSEEEQVRLTLRLSKQESKYGKNMFDELEHMDPTEIETLESFGFDFKDAVEMIFKEHTDIAQGIVKDDEEAELVVEPESSQAHHQQQHSPHVQGRLTPSLPVSSTMSMIDNPLRRKPSGISMADVEQARSATSTTASAVSSTQSSPTHTMRAGVAATSSTSGLEDRCHNHQHRRNMSGMSAQEELEIYEQFNLLDPNRKQQQQAQPTAIVQKEEFMRPPILRRKSSGITLQTSTFEGVTDGSSSSSSGGAPAQPAISIPKSLSRSNSVQSMVSRDNSCENSVGAVSQYPLESPPGSASGGPPAYVYPIHASVSPDKASSSAYGRPSSHMSPTSASSGLPPSGSNRRGTISRDNSTNNHYNYGQDAQQMQPPALSRGNSSNQQGIVSSTNSVGSHTSSNQSTSQMTRAQQQQRMNYEEAYGGYADPPRPSPRTISTPVDVDEVYQNYNYNDNPYHHNQRVQYLQQQLNDAPVYSERPVSSGRSTGQSYNPHNQYASSGSSVGGSVSSQTVGVYQPQPPQHHYDHGANNYSNGNVQHHQQPGLRRIQSNSSMQSNSSSAQHRGGPSSGLPLQMIQQMRAEALSSTFVCLYAHAFARYLYVIVIALSLLWILLL